MTIARWILTAMVALPFVFFGVMKVFGVPKAMYEEAKESYDRFGVSRNAVRLIGICELIATIAILLWTQNLEVAQVGYISLMVITTGAMYYHNKYDTSVFKEGMPAVVQFSLNAILLVLSFIA